MAWMGQMARTLIALIVKYHTIGMQVDARENEQRQIDCQHHQSRYFAPFLRIHVAKIRRRLVSTKFISIFLRKKGGNRKIKQTPYH